MIRHFLYWGASAFPISSLALSMKPSSIETLLVAAVVIAAVESSGLLATEPTAVALTTFAVSTHVEVPVAITAFGLSEENAFVGDHHAP